MKFWPFGSNETAAPAVADAAGINPAAGTPGQAHTAASSSRKSLKGWRTISSDANGATLDDHKIITDRARDLVRNAPVAKGAANTLRNSVVGRGMVAAPAVAWRTLGIDQEAAAEWNKTTRESFELWATDPVAFDAAGKVDFYQSQAQVVTSVFGDGELFAMLPMFSRPG